MTRLAQPCWPSKSPSICAMKEEWITHIQPPGLMKMRLMYRQEHHLGHQAPKNNP